MNEVGGGRDRTGAVLPVEPVAWRRGGRPRRQGAKKFGPPSEAVVAGFNAILDLERLADRTLDAANWDELRQTR